MSRKIIGIDVGGTNVLAAVTTPEGEVVAAHKVRTAKGLNFADSVRYFRDVAEKALAETESAWTDVEAVGLALPSSIDPTTGILRHAPNLGWQNEQALQPCKEIFGKPVALGNDVSCGLYAEFLYGAAKGTTSAAGYFVGTGLGGGLVLDGRLRTGPHGLAGELGHVIVKSGGRKCGCGNRGCLEAYCSKVAFGKQFRRLICGKKRKSLITELVGEELDNVRSRSLREAFKAGDQVVCSVLKKGMKKLGVGAAGLAATVDVDCIVFGGGVMEALGPQLMPSIKKGFAKSVFAFAPEEVKLKLSELGDDAVPLGAAAIALETVRAGA